MNMPHIYRSIDRTYPKISLDVTILFKWVFIPHTAQNLTTPWLSWFLMDHPHRICMYGIQMLTKLGVFVDDVDVDPWLGHTDASWDHCPSQNHRLFKGSPSSPPSRSRGRPRHWPPVTRIRLRRFWFLERYGRVFSRILDDVFTIICYNVHRNFQLFQSFSRGLPFWICLPHVGEGSRLIELKQSKELDW